MSSHGAATTTNQIRYQGYPYTNPVVIDVPSLDPNTQQWQHLPRKPAAGSIQPKPLKLNNTPKAEDDRDFKNGSKSNPEQDIQDIVEDQVAYVNLPGPSHNERISMDFNNDHPTIYVDLPSNGSSTISERLNDDSPESPTNLPGPSNPTHQMTTNNASSSRETNIPSTIYFDQFENRIITPKDSNSDSSVDSPLPNRTAPQIPEHQFQKQTTLYGANSQQMGRMPIRNDGFDLSPIPLSEFQPPPPPYTEFQEQAEQPRTQVITSSMPMDSPNRKHVICQYCGTRVQTLMLRQVGAITHVIAISFTMFCLLPCTALVYMTDWFKYKNHYCPHCAKLIGYEVPVLCQKMVFLAPENRGFTSSLTTIR